MLLILGIVAIVVFTIQVYKTASGTERNAALWSLATAGIGIGGQFILPLILGVVLGIYYISTGTPVEQLQEEISGIATVIGIVGIVLSIVGMWLVMKHVSKIDDSPTSAPPPPPPTFDQEA